MTDYSTWTFEQLLEECYKRGILSRKEGSIWEHKVGLS